MKNEINIDSVIENRPLDSFNFSLIAISFVVTMLDGFDMQSISYVAPYLTESMNISKPALGLIFSSGTFGMMLGGIAFSYLGDQFGRRILTSAALLFGILTLVTAFCRDYNSILIMRFLDGCALGGLLPLIWAVNIEFVPTRVRATVISVVMVGYSLGSSLAAPMTSALAPRFGWSAVFLAGGIASLLVAVLLLSWLPESVRFLAAKGRGQRAIVEILKRIAPALNATAEDTFVARAFTTRPTRFKIRDLFGPNLWKITCLIWVSAFASAASIYLIANWGPTLLESIGFSRSAAGNLIATGTLLGACGGLLTMRWIDTKGSIALAIYPSLAVLALLTIGLGLISPNWLRIPLVLAPAFIAGGHLGILSIFGIYYPTTIRANGAGWAASISKFGGILGPALLGLALTSDLPTTQLIGMIAIFPATLALCALALGKLEATRNELAAVAAAE